MGSPGKPGLFLIMTIYKATAAKLEVSTDGKVWEDITDLCGPVELSTAYSLV